MQLPVAATSEWRPAPPSGSGTVNIIRHKSASLQTMDATLHRRLWSQKNGKGRAARVGGLHDSGVEHGHAAFNMERAIPPSDASFAPGFSCLAASISHPPLLFSTDTSGRDPSSSPSFIA